MNVMQLYAKIQTKMNFHKLKFMPGVVRMLSDGAPLTKVASENGIKRITLCNPRNRNALSLQMMHEIHEHILCDQNNISLRVIILAAEGSVFSAGHNLKELTSESGKTQHEEIFNKCSDIMISMMESPVPIIAEVDGLAAAAGCQLVAQCDLAVCSERSTFSTPGANFGIFCSTPGIPLARCVPKMNALYMLLTGLPISSSEAHQYGLVSKVSSNDNLKQEVDLICRAIISKSRSVIDLGKKFYYKQIQEDIRKAYYLGGKKMVENIGLRDGSEGINSFVEKRKAQWRHTFD